MIIDSTEKAKELLLKEEVVAIPTETVYGLAASAFSEKAIRKIYAIKNRPFENPLIVHVSSIEKIKELVTEIPEDMLLLMEHFSPGPITYLLPKKEIISNLVTAGKPKVAVRIPNHAIALELLEKVAIPIVAPSANPFQRISPINAQQVNNYFEKDNIAVLNGGVSTFGIESTIVGHENGIITLYREGFITISEIEKVIKKKVVNKTEAKTVEAPGMYKKHYAPNCDMIIAADVLKELDKWTDKKVGLLTFEQSNADAHHKIALSKNKSTKEALSKLYNALHEMEEQGVDLIITELFPADEYGKIINNRLLKASY
jgi:L-threonylcarbamoyladenylate synthase